MFSRIGARLTLLSEADDGVRTKDICIFFRCKSLHFDCLIMIYHVGKNTSKNHVVSTTKQWSKQTMVKK